MGTIIKPFVIAFKAVFDIIFDIVGKIGLDKGAQIVLSIFILTILVRLLVLPLNIKSMRSSAKMQELQPELQKIQNKYKNDPEKQSQMMMQLYKDNNVSMMGGCLPMLIQLPILWALYYVFLGIKGSDGASFLWIKNLAQPDKLFILPILSAATTYLSSILMTKSQPQQQGAAATSMNTMNIVTSVMMGVMAINFQSMLVLYWIIGNLVQLVQTYFIYVIPAKKKKAEQEAKEALETKTQTTKNNNKKNNKKIKNK